MMKIIILGSAHPLRGGGIATFNERMAEVLQQQGHEVIIYSFSLQYPTILFPGKSQFTDEPAPAHLQIKSVINSINPLNWLIQGNKIKNENADLIIVRFWLPFMGPCLGSILRIVRGNKHTKIISITDNVIPHEKRFGDTAFTKYFLKPVDAFVAMSKEVLQDLKTFSNKPAIYSPHPLYDNYGAAISRNEALASIGLPIEERYLLFFGFIRKYKGLDWLLEAMNDSRIKEQNYKLIIAGEFYGDETLYTQLIEQYDLNDRVKLFTNFIPNNEVRNYFCAADLIVQPYKTATQSGITQIAYHFEKPMVVTNVGGLAENVPNGKVGFVAEPNPTSIADAILKFFAPNAIPTLAE
ncbi:MAG: glycosyltransferase family 4 protein, partial [Chitinophagaceae bacterium]|nr:glycosyltransferase family 4 protein [Chitinophagaceae bacterium]